MMLDNIGKKKNHKMTHASPFVCTYPPYPDI